MAKTKVKKNQADALMKFTSSVEADVWIDGEPKLVVPGQEIMMPGPLVKDRLKESCWELVSQEENVKQPVANKSPEVVEGK